MEIEKKYLCDKPENLDSYPHTGIEQAYLCTAPVVRVRRDGDEYYLTYKSSGMMSRAEYNLPLDRESYLHLLEKADNIIIRKTRYRIPSETDGLTVELDVFHDALDGLIMAEVEFPTEEAAGQYVPEKWFKREVTFDSAYHNSVMSVQGLPAELRGTSEDA